MSIADKITSIETHITNAYDKLNNLPVDLTNVDKNIDNISACLNTVYDNLPKTTGEGTEVSLNTIKGRMLITEKGNTIQDGTPSPDNEVPIKVVTGDNTVQVRGINWFDGIWEEGGYNSSTGAKNTDSTARRNVNPIYLNANETYIVSNNGTGVAMNVLEYKTNGTFIQARTISSGNSFTTNSETSYINIFRGNTNIDKVQIQKGSTITAYEPYISPISKQLDLGDIELCKISTYQDYLYKSNDKWYKKEYIGKVVLTGSSSEGWTMDYSSGYVSNRFICENLPSLGVTSQTNFNYGYCNIAKVVADASYTNILNGIKIRYINSKNRVDAMFNLESVNALTTLLSNTNMVIYYQKLGGASDIEITNTTLISQLEEIDNLMSNNGTTIISTECEEGNANLILDVTAIGTDATQPTGTISITTNGSHNVTNYATANVNVTPATETKTVKSTTTSQTINPTSGKLISQITVTPITLDTVNVTPSTSSQTVTPTHDGIGTVNVSAVTSSIDNNIVAGNIKKDVSILGVTGTYEGSGGTFVVPDGMKFRDSTLVDFPTMDTSNVTNFSSFFRSCSSIVTLPNIDISNGIIFTYFCTSCSDLENVPVLNLGSAGNVVNMFSSCSKLTNTSLNNIMASLVGATEYSGVKTLKTVGLSSAQATTCTSLSNWTALSTAGWTTGY